MRTRLASGLRLLCGLCLAAGAGLGIGSYAWAQVWPPAALSPSTAPAATAPATTATATAAPAGADGALQSQIAQAREALAPGRPPRIVFAGFAMHSDSTAFRGDVALVEKALRGVDPHAVVYKLANPVFGQPADWPPATRENIATALSALAAAVRENDRTVLLFSTHGSVDVLAVQQLNTAMAPVSPQELKAWLEPLAGKPTLVLLSACYSGSFLPALRSPARVVLTAAASSRASFGCHAESHNTFFIEELFGQAGIGKRSVVELFSRAKVAIDYRERSLNVQPSLPQAYYGPEAQAWSRQPLAAWLGARQ